MKRLIVLWLALLAVCVPAATAATPNGAVLYVMTPGHMTEYQIGSWNQIASVSAPTSNPGEIRGTAVDLGRHSFYVTYGGKGGRSGNGSMYRYDFVANRVIWNIHFNHGVDMPAVCGGKIYLAAGNASGTTIWYVLDADTGAQTGTLTGGKNPHNTICHNGIVYMGGEDSSYLYAHGGAVATKSGPVNPAGIRPFTVNAADTRAWVTETDYRGFSVLNTRTGTRLATVRFGPNPASSPLDAYSHGVSLNPAGTEVYVLDTPAQSVRVYTATDSPRLLATIKLRTAITGSTTCGAGCSTHREGWLLHSYDGRYVFVGDSGDVISTASRTVVAHLAALQNDRHGFVEVDWSGGAPVRTTTHFGVGH